MKNKTTITSIIIVVLVLIIGTWVVTSSFKQSSANLALNNNQTTNNNLPQLFADSPLSQNAYLISGPTFDTNTQTALAGFNVTKKVLADNSTEVTLNSTNPQYQTQTYTVKPGQKLYFIETMSGDDNNNEDRNLGDDAAILVDANGYIVSQ